MPDLTLTTTADGHAALTIDGAPVATLTMDRGGLTVTLPAADRADVNVRREVPPPAHDAGGLTWTATALTATAPGMPPITCDRMTPDTNPGTATPEGVPPLFGQAATEYDVIDGITRRRHMLLMGPTGAGKSTVVRRAAEALGWSLVATTITPGTTAEDLLGGLVPAPGESVRFDRIDGPITRAVRQSTVRPTLLLLDEGTRIDRVSEYAALYPVLDGQGYLMVDGESVPVGDLVVVMTANPADGDYIGTHALDPALSNRFGWKPAVTYPEAVHEAAALMARVPGLDQSHADTIAEVARRIRMAPDVSVDMGFRTLHEWASAVASGRRDLMGAADLTIIPEAAEQSDAVRDLIGLVTTG